MAMMMMMTARDYDDDNVDYGDSNINIIKFIITDNLLISSG